ncbi:META domain-containing protein [Actinokineospora enzanensis]|uniref:META domain-containing protein n=1 Tax=Actinokineospora enzanensis TaxID=155975 RepID=UPI0003796633|nr:META domain-containing protein [Actinokineospora enzanensis]
MTDDAEQRLRDLFAEGADHAPSAAGLVEAVHRRVTRRRHRRIGAGLTVLAALAVGGIVLAPLSVTETAGTAAGGMAAERPNTASVDLTGVWVSTVKQTPMPPSQVPASVPPPRITFTADGRWEAADGCTRLTGRYSADGSLSPNPTFAADCADKSAEPLLLTADTYELTAGRLTFYDAAHRALAVYTRPN